MSLMKQWILQLPPCWMEGDNRLDQKGMVKKNLPKPADKIDKPDILHRYYWKIWRVKQSARNFTTRSTETAPDDPENITIDSKQAASFISAESKGVEKMWSSKCSDRHWAQFAT